MQKYEKVPHERYLLYVATPGPSAEEASLPASMFASGTLPQIYNQINVLYILPWLFIIIAQ